MKQFHRMQFLMLFLFSGLLVAVSVHAVPVKLTVLLPFSNIYKNMGLSAKQGFLLGVQTEAANLNADWESWITFEFLDTRTDKAHSLQLAKDTIANGSKAILGFIASSVALHLRDYILDEGRIPFVIFGATTSSKLRRKHPLFLRVTNDARHYSLSLGLWLKEHPIVLADRPRWVCIYADYSWGVSVCNGFKQGYQDVGEEIGRVPVPLKTLNKKRELVQLAKLNPDFVVAAFAGGEAQVFIRDYYRFKMHQKFPLVMPGVAFSSTLMQKHAETLEEYGTGVGVLNALTHAPNLDNAANQHFGALYKQTYSTDSDIFAIPAYDAGRLLVKALARLQGKWDGQQVVHLMKTLSVISPRDGRQLQFDTHGDAVNTAYIFMTKRDGNRLVNEVIGQIPSMNIDNYEKR